jgi:hypothetical protein
MPNIKVKWIEYLGDRFRKFKEQNPGSLFSKLDVSVNTELNYKGHTHVIEICTAFRTTRVTTKFSLSYSMHNVKTVSRLIVYSTCSALWKDASRSIKNAFDHNSMHYKNVHEALVSVFEHTVKDTSKYIRDTVMSLSNAQDKADIEQNYPPINAIAEEITPELVQSLEPQWICEIAMPVAELLAKKTQEIDELSAREHKKHCELTNKYFRDTNDLRAEIRQLKAPKDAQSAELIATAKNAEIAELKKKVSDAQEERRKAMAASKKHWEQKTKLQTDLKAMEQTRIDERNEYLKAYHALEGEYRNTATRLQDTQDLMCLQSYNYCWMEARMNLAISQLESQPRPLKRSRSSSF